MIVKLSLCNWRVDNDVHFFFGHELLATNLHGLTPANAEFKRGYGIGVWNLASVHTMFYSPN